MQVAFLHATCTAVMKHVHVSKFTALKHNSPYTSYTQIIPK